MKCTSKIILAVLAASAIPAVGMATDVNLFIGTAGYGHLYPGPKWPNGMVSPGPDTGTGSWSYCSGYQYGDKCVRGFSQIHASGMGAAEFMDVLLQPFRGAGDRDPDWGLMDKGAERAEPGYYACELTNHQVRVELTASPRVAYHRYTFKGKGQARVLVDLAWGARMWGGIWQDKERPRVLACTVDISPEGAWVTGQNTTQAFAKKDIAYAVMFSRKPVAWRQLPAKPADGPGKRYVFDFDIPEDGQLLVKAALSSVDAAAAKANLLADPAGFDFDARRADCAAAWDDIFSRAVPEGDARTCRIFNTSLYHSFLEPSLFCDVDGRFRGADGKIHRSDGYVKYTMFSLWDTYRAQCPLFSLLRPELVRDLALSMLGEYDEIGRVAKHQTWGQEVYCMVGDHSIPFIVDSCLKGFLDDVDPRRILKALDATARRRTGMYRNFDYDKVGYFPINTHGSPCSHTLEHCLDDACVAMLAKRLGDAELTSFYSRRAQYYRKLFDPTTGCFRARYENGDWRTPFDPLEYGAGGSNRDFDYTESCALNYAWHQMHDPDGLIELHGGRTRCLAALNRLFQKDEGWATRRRDGDCTGLIGEYAHGNEPQHHIAYYYQFLGRGDRTAEVVREICERLYTDDPRGVCGNDDCGQMSAWYVFSAMGFYPFMPCGGEYVLGAPQLRKVVVRTGDKTLTVRADGISPAAKYVRSVSFNGKPLDGFKLRHGQLAAGGEMVFQMTDSRSVAAPCFTMKLQIDFSDVAADEMLYEAGPVKLAFRMAGRAKELESYDNRLGNYMNFPMPDGTCPVIEATICGRGGRVGIPLGALARADGVHDVTLNFSSPHWTICVDGMQDDDMPPAREPFTWPEDPKEKSLSPRVKKTRFSSPALADALPKMPDSRRIARSIQYWTPNDPNAWVGDVALGTWRNRLHVFYLFDRRHHRSGAGTGRHYFAHISSADLVNWDEHPHAVPIDEWWETLGTGTPFVHEGRFHLAYGLHTDRLTNDPAYPIGATYAMSEDGIHFVKSRRIVHATQNPTIYNRTDGLLGLVAGYGGMGGLWTSDHIGDWKLYDGNVPVKGDCPCLFEWNGRRYLFQGFIGFAYSSMGTPGTFVDWAKAGFSPYEGLSVPMVAPFGTNRRIMAGWLTHLSGWGCWGWGGWLVFRELIQNADGTLGTRWVPEITPPVPPITFTAQPGQVFRLVIVQESGDGAALTFTINPAARTATFIDDVPNAKLEVAHHAQNFRISNLPEFTSAYPVRLVQYWDKKSNATIFDAEIGGERTMICRRAGKFREASMK